VTRYLVDVAEVILDQDLQLPAGFRFIEAGPRWHGPADGGHASRTTVVEDDDAPADFEGRKVGVWLEKDHSTGEVRVSSRELLPG